jgi:hypothetical protein
MGSRKMAEGPVVTLRLMLAALGAAAIVAGFCLPTLHDHVGPRAEPKSQIEQIEVGRN